MRVSTGKSLLCLLAVLLICVSQAVSAELPDSGEWISLFDGRTLDGWEVREGKGKFFVEDDG